MIDQVVATDTAAMQGDQITGILDDIPIGSGLFLDGIGTIGDGCSI